MQTNFHRKKEKGDKGIQSRLDITMELKLLFITSIMFFFHLTSATSLRGQVKDNSFFFNLKYYVGSI